MATKRATTDPRIKRLADAAEALLVLLAQIEGEGVGHEEKLSAMHEARLAIISVRKAAR